MAPHMTVWGDNEHIISPVGSSTHSIVSVESILLDAPKNPPDSNENPRAAESRVKGMGPQATKLPGNRSSVVMNSGADDSFIRHPKYFFMDGNITFLVRDVHDGKLSQLSLYVVRTGRSKAHSTAFIDTSSLETRYTSPPDLPNSTSVITKLSRRSCR